eukprot:3829553-Prymnesium_polylepis.1
MSSSWGAPSGDGPRSRGLSEPHWRGHGAVSARPAGWGAARLVPGGWEEKEALDMSTRALGAARGSAGAW